jgi:hypothetical protein
MAIVLSQLFHYNLHPSIKNLYYKGKGYELLSLYFNQPKKILMLNNVRFWLMKTTWWKLEAKKLSLLIWRNHRLQELADEIGLNLKKLKMGFKQIYGDTVYGFFDYKMDFAETAR